MKKSRMYIHNARIVLPDKVIKGCVFIEGSRISEISEKEIPAGGISSDALAIDAEEAFVIPGMIDIHSDAIEKEIQPRPNTYFPVLMAYQELEKKLAASGITTMYHSLSLSDQWGVRDSDTVIGIINSINRLKNLRSMINHKIHLRYELTYFEGIEILEDLIESRSIDLMSYMDHTPGQGQFKSSEDLKKFTVQSYGKKENEVEAFITRTLEYQTMIDRSKLSVLAEMARFHGIRLASHDDDTKEKIDELLQYQGSISEFPINLETAVYAKQQGLHVCVGAPNIVRGRSHSNNMRAMDAIRHNAADIICSDYLPAAMLPAVFQVVKEGFGLAEAVKMVSLNPAAALGIDEEVGAVQEGKQADLLVVELHQDYPAVRKTIVGGRLVYQADYQ